MTTLNEFFEGSFLEAQDLDPLDRKRFRNSINGASLMIGHPVVLIDVAQPSFRKQFVDHLLAKGFTLHRAEAFSSCLRKLRDAMRADSQVRRPPNCVEQAIAFVGDYRGSLAAITTDLIFENDQLLAGDAEQLEKIQACIDSCGPVVSNPSAESKEN